MAEARKAQIEKARAAARAKADLQAAAGISSASVTKLAKNENINTEVLQKICAALNCDIGDIMEMIPDSNQ